MSKKTQTPSFEGSVSVSTLDLTTPNQITVEIVEKEEGIAEEGVQQDAFPSVETEDNPKPSPPLSGAPAAPTIHWLG